jgi:L-ribulose-5-phosphate 4-epimerase
MSSVSKLLSPNSQEPQDGVIKYQLGSIEPRNCHEFTGFKDLEAWRSQLYQLNLIGQYPDGVGYGNLSVRVQDQCQNQSFYITATQTGHLPNLDISDYPQVLSYSPSDHSLTVRGSKLPSSEAPTHSAIYALSPQINTIFHIHSPVIWETLLNDGHLATSADVEYGTSEMAREIARIYASIDQIFDHNVFVMAGHTDGIFAFGQNPDQAGFSILNLYNRLLRSHEA